MILPLPRKFGATHAGPILCPSACTGVSTILHMSDFYPYLRRTVVSFHGEFVTIHKFT